MSGQTPAQLLRDMEARNSAIRRYAAAHDRFAAIEQVNIDDDPAEAQGAAIFAGWCLRAVRIELDDPEPQGPCECQVCLKAYVG